MSFFKRARQALPAVAFALLCALAPAASATAQTLPAWDEVPLAQGQTKPDLVLTGTVTHKDFRRNLSVPFDVPKDVQRIGVELEYTKPDGRTVINLGLFDGERFRGWSGSNKRAVVVDENNATPSFIAGPVGGRRWALDLGVSWISEETTSQYTAKIYFFRYGQKPAVSTFSPEPLEIGARWYRGDFHMHTGESDGFCSSRKGRHIPCPVFRTVLAAEEAHLDFIGMTDHNNVGHYNSMRELQPYFDDVLLIPGREMTTEQGHANIFGVTQFVDYRLGEAGVPDMATMLRKSVEAGAIASINHPTSPTDARCRGCGWTAPDEATAYVSAMEAVNAGSLRRQTMGAEANAGIVRWEAELAKGRRITAIGGSDNHDVELGRYGVGYPTTLVYADVLSERAILDAVKAGHVMVATDRALDRGFDLKARSGAQVGMVGDDFAVPAGQTLTVDLHLTGIKGAGVVGLVDGKPDPALSVDKLDAQTKDVSLNWQGDGARHWIRFELRKGDERLMMTNPVYVNFGK